MFPSTLLARLFVHGSLRNTPDGFEFTLKNVIESGTITGWSALRVGSTSINPAKIVVRIGEKEIQGDQISFTKPVYVRTLAEIHVKVQDAPLKEGVHNILIALNTAEAGKFQFSVNEPVSV